MRGQSAPPYREEMRGQSGYREEMRGPSPISIVGEDFEPAREVSREIQQMLAEYFSF